MFLTVVGFSAHCQEQVNILATDEIIYNEKLYGKQQLLKGNVKLEYSGSILQSEEAFLKENSEGFVANRNVRINQGDTLFLRGEYAKYTSATKIAQMRDSVELEDKDLLLTGPALTYNRLASEAYYTERSHIDIKQNGHFIESNKGHYYKAEQRLSFVDSVVYQSDVFIVRGEDLDYFTNTETIKYLTGATTTRLSDSAVFYSDKAIYKQKINQAIFYGNVSADNNGLNFIADSLYFNDSTNVAIAYNRIEMRDSVNDWLLLAPYAENYRDNDSVSIPYRSEMILLNNGDSIHLFADSLSIYGSEGARKVLATGNVSLTGRQFQGVCDSLRYTQTDSSITMISAPVLWQDSSQIIGNRITLYLGDDGVERMYIPKESFITEKVGRDLYNQVKGRELTAYFIDGSMRNILIKGNGQSIYHAFDDKKDAVGNIVRKYIGVNISECSDMEILMKVEESGVSSIKFLTKPDNKLKPAAIIGSETFFLNDFQWEKDRKPSLVLEREAFQWFYSPISLTTIEVPLVPTDSLKIEEGVIPILDKK